MNRSTEIHQMAVEAAESVWDAFGSEPELQFPSARDAYYFLQERAEDQCVPASSVLELTPFEFQFFEIEFDYELQRLSQTGRNNG